MNSENKQSKSSIPTTICKLKLIEKPEIFTTQINNIKSFLENKLSKYIIKINIERVIQYHTHSTFYPSYFQVMILEKNNENEYEIKMKGYVNVYADMQASFINPYNVLRKSENKKNMDEIKMLDFMNFVMQINDSCTVVNNRMSLVDHFLINDIVKIFKNKEINYEVATCLSEPPVVHGLYNEIEDEGSYMKINFNSINLKLVSKTVILQFSNFYLLGRLYNNIKIKIKLNKLNKLRYSKIKESKLLNFRDFKNILLNSFNYNYQIQIPSNTFRILLPNNLNDRLKVDTFNFYNTPLFNIVSKYLYNSMVLHSTKNNK